jgi:methionyl-tRNA formyltransferase
LIDLKHKQLPLKVIFWGYHYSGFETYKILKQSDVFKVVGLVLPTNRQHDTIDKMKDDAKNSGIAFFEPNNLSDDAFVSELKKLSPDLHFVDSYSKLIPKKVIDITGLGFNLHPGLLPQYRGAHVLNWAILNGEKETGLSLHILTDKFDEGAVVACEKAEIALTDTAADLDKKLIEKIPALIKSLEKQIRNGKIEFQKQEGKEHHWPARTPKDGEILISENVMQIHNKIRAVSYPWGGAFIISNDKKIIIWKSMPSDAISNHPSGSWVEDDHELYYVGSDKKLLHVKSINSLNTEAYKSVSGKESIDMLKANGIPIKTN